MQSCAHNKGHQEVNLIKISLDGDIYLLNIAGMSEKKQFPVVTRVRALGRSLCCVLGQDTLLSQSLSPPKSINGYRQNAGGLPAMD